MSLNLNKLNEDFLYQRLEQLETQSQESSDEYKAIDAELNRRAELHNAKILANKEAERIKKEEIEKVITEYEAVIAEHGEDVTMRAMVLEFGDLMRDDYVIDDVFTVKSLVAGSNTNTTWSCEDLKEAKEKVEQLIYWRVYDKFFRDGADSDTLLRLKIKIVELKLKA